MPWQGSTERPSPPWRCAAGRSVEHPAPIVRTIFHDRATSRGRRDPAGGCPQVGRAGPRSAGDRSRCRGAPGCRSARPARGAAGRGREPGSGAGARRLAGAGHAGGRLRAVAPALPRRGRDALGPGAVDRQGAGGGAVRRTWCGAQPRGGRPPVRFRGEGAPDDRRERPCGPARAEPAGSARAPETVGAGAPWSPPLVTAPATVLDLVELARTEDDVVSLVAAAVRARVRADSIASEVARRPRLRNRGLLVELLTDVGEGVESALELRYRRDVERRHGLPRATLQVRERVGGRWIRADALYVGMGVRAELDGSLGHPGGRTDCRHVARQRRGGRAPRAHAALPLVPRRGRCVRDRRTGRGGAAHARLAGPGPPLRPHLPRRPRLPRRPPSPTDARPPTPASAADRGTSDSHGAQEVPRSIGWWRGAWGGAWCVVGVRWWWGLWGWCGAVGADARACPRRTPETTEGPSRRA